MIKKLMLSLCAVAMAGLAAKAQQGRMCATDEFHKAEVALHPEIKFEEERMKAEIDRYISGRLAASAGKSNAKTTFDATDESKPWGQDTTTYHIPVVVHLIYDNAQGALSITDADVFGMVDRLNKYYGATDPNLTGIIKPFQPYIGNPHIMFHLANTDPQGKPTHGITRDYYYSTNGGDESAKLSQWPPNQYLNIWLENYIGRGATKGIVLAYATFPTDYSNNPYSQGVISRADQALKPSPIGDEYTIGHEVGHYLFLYHTWNNNGHEVEDTTVCGDDEVDDTPPTYGHFSCGFKQLYDTSCAKGYLKDYDSTTFAHMLGQDGIIARNVTADADELFIPGVNRIGQSFIANSTVPVQSITIRVDSNYGMSNDTLRMKIYDALGTTLLDSSNNFPITRSKTDMVFTFTKLRVNAATSYKFVVDRVNGKDTIAFYKKSSDVYGGGVLYNGAGGNTAVTSNDLYFIVTQLRRIDYPDTTNAQNIMDYSGCPNEMFSKGQVARMRAALRTDVRKTLIDTANLVRTGIMDGTGSILPRPDINPTALFMVNRNFLCADGNSNVIFTNYSYNDVIQSASWSFDKGATTPTSTSTSTVFNSFSQPGWVTATLTVNDDDTGHDTYTRNDLVYAADPNGVQPYIEDFNPGSQFLDRFPIFNYFSNPAYKWTKDTTSGFYDRTSIKFSNYDPRNEFAVTQGTALNTATLSPRGLYADFMTPAYNLSGFGGNCFLDFQSAGAFRTTKPAYQNDTLLISYSTNCGASWTTLTKVVRADLANNGYVAEPLKPTFFEQWKEHSYTIPPIARTSATFFRFRFISGTDNAYLRFNGLDWGTGNNFYLDRLTVTENPLSVKNGVIVKLGMNIVPNPTSGAATVSINGGDNSVADLTVTDVTGKLVYHTSVVRTSLTTEVEIPASALSVKGMYLVKVVTNGATETKKLVAY